MTDFLIIGGGVAGVSAAARLSAHGSVTLLEAEDAIAYHASGRSAALFEESYGLPPTRALNRASRAFHDAHDLLSPRGLMMVGMPETQAAFDHDADDMGLNIIDGAEARARVPILSPRIDRAGVHDAMDLDTDRMIQTFARVLTDAGGQIERNARITAIRREGGKWIVTVAATARQPERDFTAKTLVNAAGAWADAVAQMAGIAPLSLTPLRRSVAVIPPPGDHDVRGWPMLFGPGETWWAKPQGNTLLVSPAEEDPVEPHDAWADDMVLAEGLARYEENVTEPVTRLTSSWAGLRTFAPDRTLILGPEPGRKDFVWCAGQGGYGMQTAPAASRLVADLVSGTAPELDADIVAMLRPDRLRQLAAGR